MGSISTPTPKSPYLGITFILKCKIKIIFLQSKNVKKTMVGNGVGKVRKTLGII